MVSEVKIQHNPARFEFHWRKLFVLSSQWTTLILNQTQHLSPNSKPLRGYDWISTRLDIPLLFCSCWALIRKWLVSHRDIWLRDYSRKWVITKLWMGISLMRSRLSNLHFSMKLTMRAVIGRGDGSISHLFRFSHFRTDAIPKSWNAREQSRLTDQHLPPWIATRSNILTYCVVWTWTCLLELLWNCWRGVKKTLQNIAVSKWNCLSFWGLFAMCMFTCHSYTDRYLLLWTAWGRRPMKWMITTSECCAEELKITRAF